MHAPDDDPISVPAEPVAGAGSPFPVLASIAPVVASVVLWSITRSPFALVFAALGPVTAVAGVLDTRWSSRRRLRSDTAGYREELARLATVIDERITDEGRFRRLQAPAARAVLDGANGDAADVGFGRWRMPDDRRTALVVGFGAQPSTVRVDGPPGEATSRLRRQAAFVPNVPVVVDAAGGIGIVGPVILAHAFARGLLIQLCNAVSPDGLTVSGVPNGWEWATALPHHNAAPGGLALRILEVGPTSEPMTTVAADVLLVLADRVDRIPTRCTHLVDITGVTAALLHRTTSTGRTDATPITVDLVSQAEARRFALELAAHARHAGVDVAGSRLPSTVAYSEVAASAGPVPPSSLSAVIGRSGLGAVLLDIVADGPHAIVGGTTGSGKSELLVTWVTSLAERYPPEAVNLLLVDFKGGAAFAPLLPLPHVVGVVTDLDAVSAGRALESLRAEVRYREHRLREAGARDIGDVPTLARLVIVVDEFAAMLDGFPDLHALFVDVAARGRSLGLHLILCTQRPAGVVRDSLLANCGLRMSLRVHTRSDSTAVLGTDAAALLPATTPGRLVLAAASGTCLVQVASVTERDVARAAARWHTDTTVRRPWLDPLPAWVTRDSLEVTPDGLRLGLADYPAEQRQDTAIWHPEADGSLLLVGASRTGKTTLLDTITAEAARLGGWIVERIGPDAELAWDVVHMLAAGLHERTNDSPGVLLLIDGLDSLLARIDADDAAELRDSILTLLRDGPRVSLRLVVSVQRLTGLAGPVAGFVGSTVLLGTANRQEHQLAGGNSANWVDARRAGSGIWKGSTVQLCAPEPTPAHPPPRHAASRTVATVDWRDAALTLLVSGMPARRAEEIRARNRAGPSRPAVGVAALGDAASGRISVEQVRRRDGPVVIVGDIDQWQAHWSLLTALRESATIVVDGCSPAEFRAVTRIRTRPPLLDRVPGRAWSCTPAGEVRRVSLEPPDRRTAPGGNVV